MPDRSELPNGSGVPRLTRWQLRRRERRVAYQRLMAAIFVVLALTVVAYYALFAQVIAPAFAR